MGEERFECVSEGGVRYQRFEGVRSEGGKCARVRGGKCEWGKYFRRVSINVFE